MRRLLLVGGVLLCLTVLPAVLFGSAALAQAVGAAAAPGPTVRVDVTSRGAQTRGSSEISGLGTLSRDGTLAVFTSRGLGSTDAAVRVYVRDRAGGTTTAVDGRPEDAGYDSQAGTAQISADGATLAYLYVQGATDGAFVLDRMTGTTTREPLAGRDGDRQALSSYALSSDGRFVAYAREQLYLLDRQTGKVSVLSHNAAGEVGNRTSFSPRFSDDARYVAFASAAGNLVAGDTNRSGECQVNGWSGSGCAPDVFVLDRRSGTMRRVSVTSTGAQLRGASWEPDISADGRTVVFASFQTGVDPAFPRATHEVYRHDMQTGQTLLVSPSTQAGRSTGESFSPAVSADGHRVAFASSNSLLTGGGESVVHVFSTDVTTSRTTRVDTGLHGPANADAGSALDVSDDGSTVMFQSDASNLVPHDTNNQTDVFAR